MPRASSLPFCYANVFPAGLPSTEAAQAKTDGPPNGEVSCQLCTRVSSRCSFVCVLALDACALSEFHFPSQFSVSRVRLLVFHTVHACTFTYARTHAHTHATQVSWEDVLDAVILTVKDMHRRDRERDRDRDRERERDRS